MAAPLLPVGVYCMQRAARVDARWVPFAAYPLAFGLQQAFEGAVWIGIDSGDAALTGAAAQGFLFFAYFFWLSWVPLSILALERGARRRRALVAVTVLGGLYGASLYLPLLLHGDWLSITVVQRSILYEPRLIYDGILDREILRVVYAAIIVGSLFVSSVSQIRVFAALIFASVIGAYLYFNYAFTSVWCFFAAILSLYVLYIVHREVRPAQAAPRPLTH